MAFDKGLKVDHSTIQRWVIRYTPALEGNSHKKRPVSGRWRMDETLSKPMANGRIYIGLWIKKAGQ